MRRLFVEPDEVGLWHRPHGVHEEWQDLGLGILVTIAKQAGYAFDTLSLKNLHSWAEWRNIARNYDLICMNVRSWRFPWAVKAAEIAKSVNPSIQVWTGGMHATAAPKEMEAVTAFDRIIPGEGEGIFLIMLGTTPSSLHPCLDSLPFIDRTVMPKGPAAWPLEGPAGWAPGKTATVITGRACPYSCRFCACEKKHFGPPRRRSVDNVLEELQYIDHTWGPIGSVVFHDSLFFMNRPWLEEFVDKYPSQGGWPFWAAARADLMRKWPELALSLIRDCNWRAISVGFESGSQHVLSMLDKHTSVADNEAVIDLLNCEGDRMEAAGRVPPLVYANFMLAIPGETQDDARQTIAMARSVKGLPGLAIYTPYPGTPLGDQLINDGLAIDRIATFADRRPKVQGVDYAFYDELLRTL